MKHSALPLVSTALLSLLLLAYAELYVFLPLTRWPSWAIFLPGLAIPAFFALLPVALSRRTTVASAFWVVLAVLSASLLAVSVVQARRWCCLVSPLSSSFVEYLALIRQLLVAALLSITAASVWRLVRKTGT